MSASSSILVVSHVIYRKNPPFDKLEGPYSSVEKALTGATKDITVCHIPIEGFHDPLTYGQLSTPKDIRIPNFLGKFPHLISTPFGGNNTCPPL